MFVSTTRVGFVETQEQTRVQTDISDCQMLVQIATIQN